MKKKYRSSPIIEAFCEFQFTPDASGKRMLNHASLSASQALPTDLSQQKKNQTVMTNLSASIGNLPKNISNLNEMFSSTLEITSSVELVKLLASEYLWQEKKALNFLSFV